MVFEQLQGAAGDVKELEYISALHQTDLKQVRQDCSIYGKFSYFDVGLPCSTIATRNGTLVISEGRLTGVSLGLSNSGGCSTIPFESLRNQG